MLSHRWKDQAHLLEPSSLMEFLHMLYSMWGVGKVVSTYKLFDLFRSKLLLLVERNNHPPASLGVCFCLGCNK